jgi:hypothetical protein
MSQIACPQCGNMSDSLQSISSVIVAKLSEAGQTVSPQVCASCYQTLVGSLARGGVLMAQEKAKENKKLMLWKSRVNLVKKARQCMNEKAFSDAAVAYEKYIKLIEMVFDAEPGGLTAEHFKDAARTQELTVIASTYWDLLRIYDTSDKYGDRQMLAAKKLAIFLRFTPIYPDIIRKASAFQKTARNPDAIKAFLKLVSQESGRCFIATAAFQYHSPEVEKLTQFRDRVLLQSILGKNFVRFYYFTSPPIASFLDKHPSCRDLTRKILKKIVDILPLN